MWKILARLTLRNRLTIIIVVGALTVFFGYKASFVQIAYDFSKLLPDDDQTFLDYQGFKERFGEDGNVMVIGAQDEKMFELDRFNDWYDLGNEIKKIDGIQAVVSIARLSNLFRNDSLNKFEFIPIVSKRPTSQQEVDSIKKVVMSLPFYEGFIYNKETHANIMAITFDKVKLNSKNRLAIVDTIRFKTAPYELKYKTELHYSGLPYIRTNIARKIAGETKLFLLMAIIITAIILLLFFRSWVPVVFSMVVVGVGVTWSFATIYLLGYKITALSGLIPPLIIVIGVPNCVLLLNKYHTDYAKHGNKMKALQQMVEKIGISTFFANVTTSIGFAVFCFTNSKILVEFGLVTALNVMGTYIVSLLFIPAVFSFLPAPSEKHTKHLDGKRLRTILNTIDYWVHHYRKRVYVIVIIVCIVSVYGLTKIQVVGYMVDDLPKNDPIYTDLHFFEANFHGVLPFEVEIDTKKKGGAVSINTIYKINKLQKILSQYKEFSKPLSVVDGIKFANQAYNDGKKKFFILPNSVEVAKLSGFVANSKQKQGTFKAFVDSAGQITRVSVQMADVGSIRMKEFVKEIRPRVDSIFDPKDYKVTLTGNCLMFLKGNDYLVKNLQESVLLAIFLISLVMVSLFASFRMVVISILPSLVPLLITAGLMGFFDIHLKPSTILIFSIAFGIASDGNMYFLTKYRDELKKHNLSISRSVSTTISETGVSMIYTAIILFFGFGIFTASEFGGTASLGILLSTTLLISYCSNLILLPSFLLSLEKRITTKAFLKEPLFEIYDEEEDIDLDSLEIEKRNNGNTSKK